MSNCPPSKSFILPFIVFSPSQIISISEQHAKIKLRQKFTTHGNRAYEIYKSFENQPIHV